MLATTMGDLDGAAGHLDAALRIAEDTGGRCAGAIIRRLDLGMALEVRRLETLAVRLDA